MDGNINNGTKKKINLAHSKQKKTYVQIKVGGEKQTNKTEHNILWVDWKF